MKRKAQIIPFPQVANPNIEELLDLFLKDQATRLKEATLKQYRVVIELLQHCLDGYGPNFLSDAEYQLYERMYSYKGLEFCSIFGADKIITAIPTFLGEFMIRKVAASESLLRSSGTVTKKLCKWLAECGYVGKAKANKAIRYAGEAAKVLPAAERLARLLYEHAHSHAPRFWSAEIDDLFVIEEVLPGRIILSSLSSEIEMVELRLPEEILAYCQTGWCVNLLLGKTPRGWQIIETGNVYPVF
ncbi:MAG TPA: hypothetical protein ENG14_00685 [Thermodesulforhabdus norvegica]|uniref:Core-binding (CB) domain-containing protein n=1 Tax=Thermodesulforhabdus norvegica TaxID=39841 RepID=A0A7C1AXM6_9BACT|nr:hypothetical protein [Deltaproteobacteria bacterium]MBW2069008.1 hypothetical protein [Deltaproteobacteria bacterium]HDL89402.1 hypothetical protein [Thermodesulforhabdus norvegica]